MEKQNPFNFSDLLNRSVWFAIAGLCMFVWNTNNSIKNMDKKIETGFQKFGDDLKFYKIIFDKHEASEKEKDKNLEKRLDSIEEKEDKIKEMIQGGMNEIKGEINDLKSIVSVIKHELSLNGKSIKGK